MFKDILTQPINKISALLHQVLRESNNLLLYADQNQLVRMPILISGNEILVNYCTRFLAVAFKGLETKVTAIWLIKLTVLQICLILFFLAVTMKQLKYGE